MNTAEPQFLVESDWLEARLDDPELRILDCMVFVHAAGLRAAARSGPKATFPAVALPTWSRSFPSRTGQYLS
jgi:hypothetical protein